MNKLTTKQRQAQFDIVASAEFKRFVSHPMVVAGDGNLTLDLKELGPTPTTQEYRYASYSDSEWSGRSSSGYIDVEADPADFDQARTEVIAVFELMQRSGVLAPKYRQLTIQGLLTKAKRLTQTIGADTQIMGSDVRLAQFWADAYALAEAEGYCHEFERMASLLGGPVKVAPKRVNHRRSRL